MMNRRDAVKTLALTSAAALAGQWVTAASAEETAPQPFILPPLPFAADALEPHIDALTMDIHLNKHHATYIKNLNRALEGHPDLAGKPIEELLSNLDDIPEEIRTTVRNNGGGHANHSLFWKCLSPHGGDAPEGDLSDAITANFGSFAIFQENMTKAALAQFGSGWAWLSLDTDKKLVIEALPNQDSPILSGNQPLFGIDIWEHAYYLHYQNRRADYVKAIWNVVDWQFIAARYIELLSKDIGVVS